MPWDVTRLEEFRFTLDTDKKVMVGRAELEYGCVQDIKIIEYHWQPTWSWWQRVQRGSGIEEFSPSRFEVPVEHRTIRVMLMPADIRYGGGCYLQYRGVKND